MKYSLPKVLKRIGLHENECVVLDDGLDAVLDIFKEYGPDSRLGMIVSIMMSCTETVIYTITIYYMSVNIKKTRWTLPGAMFATIAGAVASVAITELIM